jgi:hypothetical protein
MREKLNESKAAQIGLVAVLVVIGAIFFLKSSGGGEEESAEAPPETTVTVESGGESVSISAPNPTAAVTTGMGELPTSLPDARPLPARFTAAYDSGRPVALLVVHDGGIDDAYTTLALKEAAAVEGAEVIVVPAKQIYRYASVTVGLDINQVPALIAMRPKRLSGGVPQAIVAYGYQTPQSVYQTIRDATYVGPEQRTYHPE